MKYNDKLMNMSIKLGALKFQTLVFKLEKIKYKVIDKIFPNLQEWYFKKCDKYKEILLKKSSNEEERKKIIEEYRFKKLCFKKEINSKQNRNYHMDLNNPNDIKKYLEYNKKLHVNGLLGNIILTTLILLLNIYLPIPTVLLYILLSFELISGIINFECINLQNYNLCRLENEKTKRVLKKIEEKKNKEMKKNMSEGSKVIGKTFRNTVDIPSVDDIINNINSKKEVEELLNYTKKHLESLKASEEVKERKKRL